MVALTDLLVKRPVEEHIRHYKQLKAVHPVLLPTGILFELTAGFLLIGSWLRYTETLAYLSHVSSTTEAYIALVCFLTALPTVYGILKGGETRPSTDS